ncbi:hypothetical protein ACP70R_008820 [Stipagrostis hirtigluma subsp. patula]
MEQQQEEESAVAGKQEQGGTDMGQLLNNFERILHQDPLIDEVGFLHPTQFCSLDCTQNSNSTHEASESHQKYFWCRDHKLAICSEILPRLYRAARDAYTGARIVRDAPLPTTDLMCHSKALLILCPDFLTAWNSRKMVLSLDYDFTRLKDELQLCSLILSYSPKNESTWSHRRWVLKKLAEQHQDMSELIEKESVLVKEIAEKSKMNYRAWRHRCWLIPYMTREQVLDELKKSTKWSELHVADNCCFHYRRSLLLALLDSHLENGEDSHSGESETYLLWKEELRWDEMLIRRYQGRESLWIHRRFLSQLWIQRLLTIEKISPSPTSLVDLFVSQEIHLMSECLNAPADEFEESRAQPELAALYILWISKATTTPSSPLCESEAGREAALFHRRPTGKSVQAGKKEAVDEFARLACCCRSILVMT